MSMIDDVKTKLTDKEYKQLCDKMKQLNKTHEGYYRMWYVTTDTKIVEDSDDDDDDNDKNRAETRYYHKFDNVVVKLEAERVAEMRKIILKVGHCYCHFEMLDINQKENLPVLRPSKGIVSHLHPLTPNIHSVIRIDDLKYGTRCLANVRSIE